MVCAEYQINITLPILFKVFPESKCCCAKVPKRVFWGKVDIFPRSDKMIAFYNFDNKILTDNMV